MAMHSPDPVFEEDDGYLEICDVGDEVTKVEAILRWSPESPDEITLEVGDLIAVDLKNEETGWWVGTNTRTGQAGLFPGTNVEEIDWTSQEEEIFQFNDELMRLADELEQFEGGISCLDSAELLMDSVATELALLVPLALKAGFCDVKSLDEDVIFLFFTRQVVCAIVNRSDASDGTVLLLNGPVTAGMFNGDCTTAIGHIESAISTLSRVPPARSQIAAEFLQAQFAGQPTEAAASALGRAGAAAIGDTMVAVIASVDALSRCQGLRTRWARLVDSLQVAEGPTEPTSVISVLTKIKDKVSLLGSVTMSSLASKLGLASRTSPPKCPEITSSAIARRRKSGVATARALEKDGATANTAAVLSSFKTRTHTQSFKRRMEGPSEQELITTLKTRKQRAPSPNL